MPGKIIKINAKLNKSVKAGETLLILEAMKMEHAVKQYLMVKFPKCM